MKDVMQVAACVAGFALLLASSAIGDGGKVAGSMQLLSLFSFGFSTALFVSGKGGE